MVAGNATLIKDWGDIACETHARSLEGGTTQHQDQDFQRLPPHRLSGGPELLFDAANLIVHRLLAISSSANPHVRRDARCSHGVHRFMASLDRCKDIVPFAFDVRSVCMKPGL